MPRQSQTNSSDDNDDDAPRSQQTQSQSSLSLDQEQRLTADVVYYLLIVDHKKIPIKRADINKHVLKEYSRLFPRIFAKAIQKLQSTFGINVKEMPNKKGSYILVNSMDVNLEEPHIELESDEEYQKKGLLTVILCLIFMNGNRIPEDTLWRSLGIHPEIRHRTLGDVHKLITKDFVHQAYLEHIKIPDSDPPACEFTWGYRAREEVSKEDLLDIVCQVYGGIQPEQWYTQYQDATQGK